MANVSIKNDVTSLYNDINEIINSKKISLTKTINSTMITLNWEIGKIISVKVNENKRSEYGQNVVQELSDRLTNEYGQGYNRASLFRMIQFYQEFNDFEMVLQLSEQLSWSHIVELLPIEDTTKRNFYATLCYNENWSVRTLRERKKSMLFERTAISKKPEVLIEQELKVLRNKKKMDVDLFYRDPYVLDFLNLKDTYSEKDLESAILNQLEKFILEMGTDFAFMARQKTFIFADKTYKMDLLFYHRTLRRLVVIDLKLGEFEPSYKGQIEMYLRWLNKYEKAEGEESPIALILCAEKSDDMIELMELSDGNIRVGQYLTKMPPKEIFERKLIQAIEIAKKNLENK